MVKKLENNREKKYVFDYIIDDIKNNCLKNTFVYNEGGIGKTTQLKKLAQMLLSPEGRKYAPNVIPIYIAVKDLHGSKNKNTLFNAIKEFCGEDSSDKELENLLDGSSSMRKDFVFLFVVDGLNEAKDEIKREVQREINNLMKFEQNIFIVSSRIDETNYFSGFDKKFFVKPLDNVCEIINASETEINPKLLEILSVPLYLKYYLYTYKKDTFYFYEDKSVRKSDILKEYLKAIDKNLEKNTVSYDKHTKDFLIDFYLPALAYELEISNEITDEKLSNIKKNIATYEYYEKILSVDVEDEIATVFKSDCFFPLKIAKEWFALNDKKGYFVHDIWREYFTASYYSKCIDKDIIDAFDNLPSEGVREFIGEIIGECDFKNEKKLEKTRKSPLNQFLQKHNRNSDKQLSDVQTRNVIEIMKVSRNNNITADYSHLDLSLSNFLKTDFSNSIFIDSVFDKYSLMPPSCFGFNKYGCIDLFYSSAAISPDGRYIVNSCKGNIQVLETDTNNLIYKGLFDESIPINIRQIVFIDKKTFIVNYEYIFAVFVIEYDQVICIAIYPNSFDGAFDCIFDGIDEENLKQIAIEFTNEYISKPRMKFFLSKFQKILIKAYENFENSFDEMLEYDKQYENMGAKEVDLTSNNALEQIKTNVDIQLKSGNSIRYLDLISDLIQKQISLSRDDSFEFETYYEEIISYYWCLSPIKNKMHIAVNNHEEKIYFAFDGYLYQFDYAKLLNDYENNKDNRDKFILINAEKVLQNSNIDLLLNWENKGLIGISSKSPSRWGITEENDHLNGSFLSYYDIKLKSITEKHFENIYICDVDCYNNESNTVSFIFANQRDLFSGIYGGYFLNSERLIVDLSTLKEVAENTDMKNIYDIKLINNCFTQTIDYSAFGNYSKFHFFVSDNSFYRKNALMNFQTSRSINAHSVTNINHSPNNSIDHQSIFAIAGYCNDNGVYHKVTDYYGELQYDSFYTEFDKYNHIQLYFEDTFGKPDWYDIKLENDKYIIRKISKHDKMNEELIDENVNEDSNWYFISNKVRDKFKDFISACDLDVDVSVQIYPKRNYLILYNKDYYFSNSKGGFTKFKNKDNACFYKQYCVWFDNPAVLAIYDLEANCLAYINSSDLDCPKENLTKHGIDTLQVCFYNDCYLSISRNRKTYIFIKNGGELYNNGFLWKRINKYLGWKCIENVYKYFLYKDGYFYINDEKLKYVVPKNNNEAMIYTLGDASHMISNHTDIACTVFDNELTIWDLRKMADNPSELKPIISNLNMNFVYHYICQNALFKNIKGLTTYQKDQLTLLGANFE